MRLIPLEHCQPGMKLAKNIYSGDGLVLLAEGMILTVSLIRRLSEYGIQYLYVHDPRTEDVQIPELLDEETRQLALRTLSDTFRAYIDQPFRQGATTYPYIGRNIRKVMKMIMDDLSRSEETMIMLMNIQTFDQYLYMHSLNVCIYTTMLGIALGYDRDQLLTLGIGALLHDIGKTQISMEVLLKPDRLTDEEFEEMKLHTERGYYLLKDEPGIPLLAAHCAYQHHERLNGTGYPRGLKSEEIHDYAKLIAIADSYDAMTSNRVYRRALLPHQAVETLYAGSGTLYDTKMLRLFRDKVAIYPIGLTVRLSSGQQAVVVRINANCVHRPVVRVLTDEYGHMLEEPYDLDLSRRLDVMVTQVDMMETDQVQSVSV
jgi:HD-GYP domain-containing protein (c-di-GMP phosphodiesterase class II)